MDNITKQLLDACKFEECCKNLNFQQAKYGDLLKVLNETEEAMKQSAGNSKAFEESFEAFIKIYKACDEYWTAKRMYDESKGEILYELRLGPKPPSKKRLEEKRAEAFKDYGKT